MQQRRTGSEPDVGCDCDVEVDASLDNAAMDGDRSLREAGGGRTGRRTGPSTTRDAIARAARDQFAAKGYAGASVRSIAERAGVDAALIAYFFGSKRRLFLEVLELPLDPQVVVPQILAGDRNEVGARLAEFAVAVLANQDYRDKLLGLLRSASQDADAAAMIREKMTEEILKPIAGGLEVPNSDLRAGLAMSQIAGLTMAQHVLGLEALRQADPALLVKALGPTLQRYLVEPLD